MNGSTAAEKKHSLSVSDRQEVVLSAKNVSKKFCKDLKLSMFYGIVDLSQSLFGFKPDSTTLRRSEFWAVDDVSFELKRGQTLGLIGVNGSGKSTLLKLVAGIFPPDKGEITVKGRIGSLISLGAGFHPHMTGRENIYLNGAILGMSHKEIDSKIESIVNFAELGDFIDAPVATYSSGMRVRLGFSIAIAIEPDILLLDEVLAVGDRRFKAKCYNEIDKLLRNAAVIFVSHSMPHIHRLCNSVMVLNKGQIKYKTHNVMEGIEYYYSLFPSDESSVSGVGEAVLHHFSLSSNNVFYTNDGILTIGFRDSLNIDMSFSLSSSVKNAFVVLQILDKEFNLLAAIRSDSNNLRIINDNSEIKLHVTIPDIQLSPGKYYITLSLQDSNRLLSLLTYHNIAQFQVTGNFPLIAPFNLVADWINVSNMK